ncbi:MAG TPA: M20 aminoacylase family protein [Paracoccaceae bacterium]|nr:M20 aminoacylase family protein [Paracoccaceae bacterium]
MPVIDRIAAFAPDLTDIRRDFHAHPEIGFQEVRTSGIVAKLLTEWGVETHTGIGKTGVVGVLKGSRPGRTIGLRADMDALPIDERTNLPYASKTPGVMHACGHDSHTTMLLGAARYLAETRDFSGTAVFIFQPAEEGLGGARAMLADKLFERFPCDEVYGMHNNPTGTPNRVGVKPGEAMAGADFFDFRVRGAGSHGAMPHQSKDPIVIATALVGQLQTIVSRNVPPTDPVVLSVTQIHAGAAYNVIPAEAVVSGTMRYFDPEVAQNVRARMRSLAQGMALAYEIEIDLDIRDIFDVLVNDETLSHAMLDVAREIVGDEHVAVTPKVRTGSEDFADMLRAVPGAYCTLGHAGTAPLHSDHFVFDDEMLPVGASIYARLVERRAAA